MGGRKIKHVADLGSPLYGGGGVKGLQCEVSSSFGTLFIWRSHIFNWLIIFLKLGI